MGFKEIFEIIVSFVYEKSIRFYHKILIIITVIFLVAMVDNTLGFSYYYYNKNKLELIKNINDILKDNVLNDKQKKDLINLNNEILNKEPLMSSVYNYIRVTIRDNNFFGNSYEKNYWYTYISSSWIYIISYIIYLFSGFFKKIKDHFLNCFFGLISFFVVTGVYSILLYYIPNIYNKPTINYIIYMFSPIIIVIIYSIFLKVKPKNI